MAKDRFDFEQDIFECWHVVNDIKQLYEMVARDRNKTPDDIANVLLGMHTLYDDRFHQLMASFENLIKREELWEEEAVNWDTKPSKLKPLSVDFNLKGVMT